MDAVSFTEATKNPIRVMHNQAHSYVPGDTERSLTERPWGWYQTISETVGNKVKRIHVHPGQQLSLQKHYRRAEHWVVVHGVARVTVGDYEQDLAVGQHVDIGMGQVHRLANLTSESVEIIEVQLGSYLGEDDIVRLQDDYGRS